MPKEDSHQAIDTHRRTLEKAVNEADVEYRKRMNRVQAEQQSWQEKLKEKDAEIGAAEEKLTGFTDFLDNYRAIATITDEKVENRRVKLEARVEELKEKKSDLAAQAEGALQPLIEGLTASNQGLVEAKRELAGFKEFQTALTDTEEGAEAEE